MFKIQVTVDVYHHFPSSPEGAILEALATIHEDLTKMNDTTERLTREVAETRDAVTALTGRYQAKIDTMQAKIDELQAAIDAEDPAAIQAAADALNDLQTEMAALGQTAGNGDPNAGTDGGGTDTSGGGSGVDTVTAGVGDEGVDPVPEGTEPA